MHIKRIPDKNFFIFEFYSKSDFDNTVDRLVRLTERSQSDKDCKSIIDKLRSRTDDKYAKGDIKMTGLLFDNEFICLFEKLLFVQPDKIEVKVVAEETLDPNAIRADFYRAAMDNIESSDKKTKSQRRKKVTEKD